MLRSTLTCLLCFTLLVVKSQDVNLKKLKSLSIEELMDVEVTSVSKHKEKIRETASAIQVITNEDIRNAGVTSVVEALRLAPNLQVAQASAGQWAVSARGFNNTLANKLLVLIDGRVVYTPMYAGVFWDVQNLVLEDIDRIEVVSGPGGTLWGANAMNGVINIITKKSSETQGGYVEAAVGTELRGLGSLRYGGMISEKISYRVYGTAFKRDNTVFHDSIEAQDDWQMAQGGLRFDWNASPNDLVTLQSNLYDNRPDPNGGTPAVARGTNILSKWEHVISEESDFNIQIYYDRTWRDFRNGFTEGLTTYDIEGQHTLSLSDAQTFIYGAGLRFMDHEVENIEQYGFLPAQKSLHLANLFAQDEIALMEDKLKITLGIKIEYNNYTRYQYQPNARIAWSPAIDQTIWAAVSRAVRNPSRIDREFYANLGPGVPYIAGSNFQSEKVTAYELGWHSKARKNLSFHIATFYNVYDDIRSIEPGPEPFGLPITLENGVEGNTYGAELSFTYQPIDWCNIRGGYTWLEKDLNVKSGYADMNNASAESNDPTHQLLVQPTFLVGNHGSVGMVIRHIGQLSAPYVSDYTAVDLRFAWSLNDAIELSVVGQNLLNDHHTEFKSASRTPKDIERSMYGKIVWRF